MWAATIRRGKASRRTSKLAIRWALHDKSEYACRKNSFWGPAMRVGLYRFDPCSLAPVRQIGPTARGAPNAARGPFNRAAGGVRYRPFRRRGLALKRLLPVPQLVSWHRMPGAFSTLLPSARPGVGKPRARRVFPPWITASPRSMSLVSCSASARAPRRSAPTTAWGSADRPTRITIAQPAKRRQPPLPLSVDGRRCALQDCCTVSSFRCPSQTLHRTPFLSIGGSIGASVAHLLTVPGPIVGSCSPFRRAVRRLLST